MTCRTGQVHGLQPYQLLPRSPAFAIIANTSPYRNKDFPVPHADTSPPAHGAPAEPLPALANLSERLRSGTCHIGIYGLDYAALMQRAKAEG